MSTHNMYQIDLFSDLESDIRSGHHLDLDPIDATFRDSSRAPLHSWFPYLEGYSPRFVERIRHEFLRDAKRVIEPFAGSGTTPIVLGQAGVECAYSEANPAMAFVVQTKLSVLKLSVTQRQSLADQLRQLARQLHERVRLAAPNEELRNSYFTVFEDSNFFELEAFEDVLRLRTLNNEISGDDETLGTCLALAILASLIPCSRLKRAGDLRYKTPRRNSRCIKCREYETHVTGQ